jgi:Tol biopolymer transport system component/tRNA A-37 threonylcarbamoyl transferase component Bud32
MTLSSGTRLGTYTVTALIGAGGMGEVYEAHDAKLDRDVAVKVLPEQFARDPERLARFQREAKLLAALNHPNIAAIYGLEQSDSTHYLVMELVLGETLRERVAGEKPIPVEEALTIAKQIAEALEAAHNCEKGIIHRDLKPANVKVTPEGKVKVLDFGLAKAFTNDASTEGIGNSPTLSMAATVQGVIMGTAAYMSPEQARGKAVTKATDIFAFGAVFYELLTGKQAFQGDDVSDILAAVIRAEPEWGLLPSETPPHIRTLLKRCLRKDKRQRLGDAGAVRIEIEDVLSGAVSASAETAPAPIGRLAFPGAFPGWAMAAALVAGAAVAGGGVWLLTKPTAAPAPVVRTEITTSGASALSIDGNVRDLAISPDGSHIVYRGNGRLLVRALDQIEPTVLSGLGAPRGVFFSPDGQWIGFSDGNTTLKKVAVTGGPAVTICSLDANPRGATWGPDGTIVFATSSTTTGLFRVSEGGGEPAVLTRPNHERGEADHLWPEFLPGGQAVLFTITTGAGGNDNSQVAVLDLRTGAQKIVLRGGSHAHYVESGHLVYAAAGTLRAIRFDLKRLETTGTPVPVVPQVVTTAVGAADFDVARDGTLVYLAGGPQGGTARTLLWIDRQGREEAIKAPPRAYVYVRLAPDGTRVALDIRDQESDIWVWDLARETLTRLTFDPTIDRYPVWTPDSKRIIFASDRAGPANLYWQAADNTGTVERLTQSGNLQMATSISPDGTRLVFEEARPSRDLMALTLDKDRHAEPLVQSQMYQEENGEVSPDGRWLAYESNESGKYEIYVRPFPEVNSGRWQVSTMGGTQPLWARSGQELFYVAPDGTLMRVAVEPGPARPQSGGQAWRAGTPVKLFENTYAWALSGVTGRSYDISADGKRFLAIKQVSAGQTGAPSNLIVVQNWFEELKQKAPGK